MQDDFAQDRDGAIRGLIARLRTIVGEQNCLTHPGDKATYLVDWRRHYQSRSPAVVRPGSTADAAAVVGVCAAAGVPVVPQGGNTGLVGGSVAGADGRPAVLINLSRLNRVRAIDADDMTMTVEAGCTLAAAKAAADGAGCLLPLTLASEGSCQVGGVLSTNAGGNNAFRHGSSRDLCLGLEVVLADGRIWNGLGHLRKDNTGYRLRELFLGAEGTLGIITAAVISLEPKPVARRSAFVCAVDLTAAVEFASLMRRCLGDSLIACELLPRRGIHFVLQHVPGTRSPMRDYADWNVLIECAGHRSEQALTEDLEHALATALERGLIRDAVVATSDAQAIQLWRLREEMPEAQRPEGGSIKHDVAVPVGMVATFIERAIAAAEAHTPGIRPVPFGHLCDGNIHFNLSQPKGADEAEFLSKWGEVNEIIHDIAVACGGTFSAEHGIGLLKLNDLRRYKDDVSLDLMRRLKSCLDPHSLLNPGKVIPLAPQRFDV